MILDLLEMHKDYNRTEPTSLPLRIVLQSVSQSCVQSLQWRVTHDGCGSVAVYRCGPAVVTMMTTPAPLFIISIIMPGPGSRQLRRVRCPRHHRHRQGGCRAED